MTTVKRIRHAVDPLSALFALLAVALLVLFLALLGSTGPTRHGDQLAYSTALRLADRGQVRRAELLDYDHRVLLTTRDGRDAWAGYAADGGASDRLIARMSAKGAEVSVDNQSTKQARRLVVQVLLPILILVSLFALFMRLNQRAEDDGVGSFSRWRGRWREGAGAGPGAGPSFADVAGAGAAVAELAELCDLLREPGRYAALGARAPKGALLVGPPGTGKTLLARATAGEASASFFSVSGAEFVESLVGVGAARIRDLFSQARNAAPAIVFIDELDAVGRKRGAGVGQGNDEREQTLNQLLVEMDGFDAGSGIVVLAATNRPDILDPALLRPGRFDRQVTIDAPDLEGRTAILSLYLAGRPHDGVDARAIARRCPGFTGAELENVVNEAALLAARADSAAIEAENLDEAIERVIGGPRSDTHVLGPDELRTIAVHEAAHAVVAAAAGDADQVHQLSVVARGRRLGRSTALMIDRDRTVLRRSDFERRLAVTMAGAAAERMAFGEVSTAVNDDLHAATQLARSMVTSFGMSALGPVTIGERSAEVFLGASLQELGTVGPATLERIDAETRAIVEAAEDEAQAVLAVNWPVVDALADELVAHETLSDAALAAHLAACVPSADTPQPRP